MPRSLVLATDLDVLAANHVVERRDGYAIVRSPGNPTFWGGNLLLFDDAPGPGDGARWEALFADAFADAPEVRHRTFAWDRTDGETGAADDEFVAHGYMLERLVGLIATPAQLRPHPRANQQVVVRSLDPDGDAAQWATVVELQVASRPYGIAEDEHRTFVRHRQEELRGLFRAGRGAWYVAQLPSSAEIVADCGVVVTGDRGRFQAVGTAEAHRRRGISSRLVVAAGHQATDRHGLRSLVIAADVDYHALGLYESLGFCRQELVCGVVRRPA